MTYLVEDPVGQCGVGGEGRVEGDEHGGLGLEVLELVQPVGDKNGLAVAVSFNALGGADVVPGAPCFLLGG